MTIPATLASIRSSNWDTRGLNRTVAGQRFRPHTLRVQRSKALRVSGSRPIAVGRCREGARDANGVQSSGLASQPEQVDLANKPGSAYPQLCADAPDRPALLDHAAVQVAGEVGEPELGKRMTAVVVPSSLANSARHCCWQRAAR